MAFFSTLSKTYAKDTLSKCATTVLLVSCYLYRKRSNVTNVNAEAKEQGRDIQTPVNDSGIFTEVSRSVQAFPSPRWSPSQGIPRKGQAPGRVTPWIVSGLPHAQMGLRRAFRQASPGPLPAVFTIKLPSEPPRALFPSVHGGGHTTNAVGVISQDYKPHRVQTQCAQAPWV